MSGKTIADFFKKKGDSNEVPFKIQRISAPVLIATIDKKQSEASHGANDEKALNDKNKTKQTTSTAVRNFSEKWLKLFSWLSCKEDRAFCKICAKSLPNNQNLLKRHEGASSHIAKCSELKKQLKIDNGEVTAAELAIDKYKTAELKIVMFLVKNNLPFSLFEPVVDLVKSLDSDSKVCQKIKLGKTKCTETVCTLLCSEGMKGIIGKLKSQHFSLIIDETTDLSCKKSLAIIARYYDLNKNQTNDSFLALLELESFTAEAVFNAIKSFFNQHDIPFKNCIGLAADNASVMMGKSSGVQALLKKENPYAYTIGCTCHSLHLCSSAAAKHLPAECEKLARDIYYFFTHSPKRQLEFKEFQESFMVPVHKILKTSKTRWLSLEGVVNRMLEQWEPLQHYFLLNKFEANSDLAFNISENLNSTNKAYFYFLSYVLRLTNNLNKEFQSERPKIYKLLPAVKGYLLNILHNFIKKEFVDENKLNDFDFQRDNIYIDEKEIYVGPKAEMAMKGFSDDDIIIIKKNCKKYYATLSSEVIKRFDFADKTLTELQKLDPQDLGGSMVPLFNLFPNICGEKIDDIEEEWRNLIHQNNVTNTSLNIENFWGAIFQQKNGLDELLYPNLKCFIGSLLSLPHSSAAAERIFSDLNNIKTKNRNRLKISTIHALLIAKQSVKDYSLCDWCPSKELLRQYKLCS